MVNAVVVKQVVAGRVRVGDDDALVRAFAVWVVFATSFAVVRLLTGAAAYA
jgi:hypothetical protein